MSDFLVSELDDRYEFGIALLAVENDFADANGSPGCPNGANCANDSCCGSNTSACTNGNCGCPPARCPKS